MFKSTRVILCAALIFSAASAFSQSDFAGGYAQIGAGYQNVNASDGGSTLIVSGTTFPLNFNFSSGSGFSSQLSIGYNFEFANDYLLGIGADYLPLSSSGNYSYSITFGDSSLSNTGSYKFKSGYTIFAQPAIKSGKDGLLYAKLGYASASTESQGIGASTSHTFNGYVVGLGYKQMLSKQWFGFTEANYMKYGNTTITTTVLTIFTPSVVIESSAYNFQVGVGYKF